MTRDATGAGTSRTSVPFVLTDRGPQWPWARQETAAGRGQPHQIAELLLRIAPGEVDRLSGRHLSVHDDLDMLLSLTDDVLRAGLYLLRLHGLPTTSLPGSTGTFVNSGPDTPQKTPK